MRSSLTLFLIAIALMYSGPPARADDVAIYTGTTQWISKPLADDQAQICADKLTALGITNTTFSSDQDWDALSDWVVNATGNGQVDVLVLYGDLPTPLYPDGNTSPDGSLAELFIESTDGDAIINHADYMFWGLNQRNGEGGLQNIMDIPGIVMWDDDTPMTATVEGKQIAPSLTDFVSDRPFHVDQLINDWVVEVAFATNEAGTRADPIIVRDGDRGRLIPVFQAADQNDPKGAVAAEIIAYLLGKQLGGPTKLGLTGMQAILANKPLSATVQVQEKTGSPSPPSTPTVISLQTTAATGKFDLSPDGAFDGSVTSLTIPAGESTAKFYYKDSAAGARTLTTSTAGLTAASIDIKVFVESHSPAGEVAIYTGTTQWITKPLADEQATIASNELTTAGITNTWYQTDQDWTALAEWVTAATGNGKQDVLVLYGDLPPSLYPDGNTSPDGSVAELFLESTDGDAIINHADYMFWGLNARNAEGGLQNLMDIPGIVMWDDDTPMTPTAEGKSIAPSVTEFLSDRPFHVDQLANDWYVELSLAQNAAGTRADPIIVRDGERGRLIPVFQAADQNDPKGAVAAEIISWLMNVPLSAVSQLSARTAGAATLTNKPTAVTILLQDEFGSPRSSSSPISIGLASSSGTGAFDTSRSGAFNGSVTTVVIPPGGFSTVAYYKDSAEGPVTLTLSSTGLIGASVSLNLFASAPVEPGEVVIYTGTTQWITKPLADEQAQICADALTTAGVTNFVLQSETDWDTLAAWVTDSTGNGRLDVLVLYGDLPSTLYPDGNTSPDGSVAELFVESTDGDVIINHADWMFWGFNARNGAGGLQNIMDLPDILMGNDNTPMVVTDEGHEIAPTLTNFLSDRPFHIDQLGNDWFAEVILAQNSNGTRADPVIVRDGNRGRLIPLYQTADQNDPKGAVAAEVISWLMTHATGGPVTPLFHRGDADNNGSLQLTDAVRILNVLFLGIGTIGCKDAADADDNGTVQLTDAVRILNVLFLGVGTIPSPGPPPAACGPDPTPDSNGDLGCDSSSC